MTRQAIIVFAVLLGAGLAGLLWYQLTRTPADENVAVATASPASTVSTASKAPVATATPTPTVVAAETTHAPIPVSNTAPTGMGEVPLILTGLAALVGGYGLRRSL